MRLTQLNKTLVEPKYRRILESMRTEGKRLHRIVKNRKVVIISSKHHLLSGLPPEIIVEENPRNEQTLS